MRHRIFIAINLSERAKEETLAAQERMREFDLPIRWLSPESIHVTLAFLGYLEDKQLEEVKKAVKEATLGVAPFRLSTGDLDFFLNIKRARVVVVQILGDTMVFKLNKQLREGLEKLRYIQLENRAFKPHLTLGRVKKEGWGRGSETLEKLKQIKVCANWEVKGVEIMESKLTPDGAKYSIVKSYQLIE